MSVSNPNSIHFKTFFSIIKSKRIIQVALSILSCIHTHTHTHKHTISILVNYDSHRCSEDTLLLSQEQERTLRAEDASWDDDIIPDLKILALRVIVSTWKDNPVLKDLSTCADKDVLVETLPTDLPFELTITRIDNDFYWERAAKDRWKHNDLTEHGGSWRRLYCERHLVEYLETLEASYFEAQREECEKLMTLVKNYVHVIRLHCLMPTK
ncbi:dynein regulatory complex subunit 5 [Harpegnathos saltator]|uniref:T-complex-associated testis-expressed protein 1 n=1 Tax=Harpegnathos saltator TaxID=610380 RepID=E2BCF9_HARSA|nr:dynein regulatory complex subunit 5 [Harpegnathos saltator]EFN86621.1 T-complex-associated testis-expressed protein 1 [Harpegnathos saltator]